MTKREQLSSLLTRMKMLGSQADTISVQLNQMFSEHHQLIVDIILEEGLFRELVWHNYGEACLVCKSSWRKTEVGDLIQSASEGWYHFGIDPGSHDVSIRVDDGDLTIQAYGFGDLIPFMHAAGISASITSALDTEIERLEQELQKKRMQRREFMKTMPS